MDLSTGVALLSMFSLNIQLEPSPGEMEKRYEAEVCFSKKKIFEKIDQNNVQLPTIHRAVFERIAQFEPMSLTTATDAL